jgi:hypothetical protein
MQLEIAPPGTKCAALDVLTHLCSVEENARQVLDTPHLSEQLVRCLNHGDGAVRIAAGRLVCELTKTCNRELSADLVETGVLAAAVSGFVTSDPAFVQLLTPALLEVAEADVADARHVLSKAGLRSKVNARSSQACFINRARCKKLFGM